MFRIGTRIPFLGQMSDKDCGPSCLAMILRHFGHHHTVYEVRQACERIGAPHALKTLIAAGHQYGLSTKALRVEPNDLANISLPALLHWGFNHYVVLAGVDKKSIKINDPSVGRRKVSFKEVNKMLTGIVVTFDSNYTKKISLHKKILFSYKNMNSVLVHKHRYTNILISLILSSSLMQITIICVNYVSIDFVRAVSGSRITSGLSVFMATILVAALSMLTLGLIRGYAIARIQSIIDSSILMNYMIKVLRLPMAAFYYLSPDELLSRLNSSTIIRDFSSSYITNCAIDIVLSFIVFCNIFRTSYKTCVILLIIILIQVLLNLISVRWVKEANNGELRLRYKYQERAREIFETIPIIRASSLEEEVSSIWANIVNRYVSTAFKRGFREGANNTVMSSLSSLSTYVISIFLYYQWDTGQLTSTEVIKVASLSAIAISPLFSLTTVLRSFNYMYQYVEQMSDVCMQEDEQSGDLSVPMVNECPYIAIQNVTYNYFQGDTAILRDITMTVKKNQKIAIIGPSGSGKSTLLSLILRFYSPRTGKITHNGVNLQYINLKEYRSKISYVPQDCNLLNASIRQNITIGLTDISLKDIERAIEIAGLTDFVASLPMKLDTLVGNQGSNLSGGQRQRISLARALCRKPEVILLDEATANLDRETEKLIIDKLFALETTVIFVTHRITSIKDFDWIYVMKSGRIECEGVHQHLLNNNPFYSDSFSSGVRK